MTGKPYKMLVADFPVTGSVYTVRFDAVSLANARAFARMTAGNRFAGLHFITVPGWLPAWAAALCLKWFIGRVM